MHFSEVTRYIQTHTHTNTYKHIHIHAYIYDVDQKRHLETIRKALTTYIKETPYFGVLISHEKIPASTVIYISKVIDISLHMAAGYYRKQKKDGISESKRHWPSHGQ